MKVVKVSILRAFFYLKVIAIILILVLRSAVLYAEDKPLEDYIIDNNSSYFVNSLTWQKAPAGGDTIFISSDRTKPLRFQMLEGEPGNPIVVINYQGQVKIEDENTWGGLVFENCRYIKVTGEGDPDFSYGFVLSADKCGLAFSELSSDCEASHIKIDHDGFFGIMVKKDYNGAPPMPAPVFSNLVIHDCLIENVVEGMYLGETKSPGMEFKHVRIYNNIVRNTGREGIQIANMVEDVEIYNNTLMKTGQHNIDQQNNVLQIGDNSVAEVYNNILMDSPGCGIISFGKGYNNFYNNYIAQCKGIFIDNRLFTDKNSPINISDNYFRDNVDRGWIIRNMNEKNKLTISDNYWNTDIPFFKNDSGTDKHIKLKDNENGFISELIFENPEEGDYSVSPANITEYLNIGASCPHDFEVSEPEIPVDESRIEQIALNASMIIDEVGGGSYWAPDYLVDEQNLTPVNGAHPISKSWKPYWNMNKGPYHIYFNLGQVYMLTTIALHDMHDVSLLNISVGEPGNWVDLVEENCDKYNTWKQHHPNCETRFLRLSMNESVYAAINELVLYGYTIENAENTTKSAITAENVNLDPDDFGDVVDDMFIIDNSLLQNRLDIHLPEDMNHNFTVEVFSITGAKVFSEKYLHNMSGRLIINVTDICADGGVYIVRYFNENGITKTLKFLSRRGATCPVY